MQIRILPPKVLAPELLAPGGVGVGVLFCPPPFGDLLIAQGFFDWGLGDAPPQVEEGDWTMFSYFPKFCGVGGWAA